MADYPASSALIKLDSNENPFGPSPLAVQAMQSATEACNLYPDNEASVLRNRLAELHGVSSEQVLITGGSTEFLGMIARAFLSNGLNAVTSQRSFIVYRLATEATNARLIEVPMNRNGFDLGAILSAVDQNTRVIFIANPNNPTGTLVTAAEVDHLLNTVPEDIVVVLDEAYYDFAAEFSLKRNVDYSRSLNYVRDARNVIVLRTFSKTHGLAGSRIGYGIMPSHMATRVARQRSLFCVSSLAQAGALAALVDQAHIRMTVENNSQQSDRLIPALLDLGITATTTWANFIYCEVGRNVASLVAGLRREGIAVRALENWGAPEAIRITIGTPQQNHALLEAIRKLRGSSEAKGI